MDWLALDIAGTIALVALWLCESRKRREDVARLTKALRSLTVPLCIVYDRMDDGEQANFPKEVLRDMLNDAMNIMLGRDREEKNDCKPL